MGLMGSCWLGDVRFSAKATWAPATSGRILKNVKNISIIIINDLGDLSDRSRLADSANQPHLGMTED